MKKIVLVILAVMLLLSSSLSFATDGEAEHDSSYRIEETRMQAEKNEVEKEEELTPASEKILNNSSKKERKIAEYTDKYNDKTNATVAYYLDLIQMYSIPVCVVGIALGAFNFYIIGEKKLDKKEKGFAFIMAFVSGLVFFQVLPLVFALLVAGK